MGFTIEQSCPQCGARIELDETDHLFQCPYCNVKSFLFSSGYHRFILPHRAPEREILYAPYLRFKGNVYYCVGNAIGHRVVDITHLGLPLKGASLSLGLRPQAMKMAFATPETRGSFLRFSLKATEILEKAGKLPPLRATGKLFHRAYVGETVSLIYLPLYVERDRLFDAVLNRVFSRVRVEPEALEQAMTRNPRWRITFLATLCPQCGWSLDGKRDSVVLTCSNCKTAWEAEEGRFIQVSLQGVLEGDEEAVYLPFWRINAQCHGLELHSYADFIRSTNQPCVVRPEMEQQEMTFWTPAFKIRPKVFLSLSRRLTVSQKDFPTDEIISKKNLYPVTLPQSEAAQALKIILASLALNKKEVIPRLPGVRFSVKGSTLIYLPFKVRGHQVIREQMGISLNRNTLAFGRRL
jgi:predicted RNA-binding Zn-ribbon protein involved in translation (DUF1610 family)